MKSSDISKPREPSILQENGFRFCEPPLGHSPKDEATLRELLYQDAGIQNAAEGKFGEGKRFYGLDRIMAYLPETSNLDDFLKIRHSVNPNSLICCKSSIMD